MDSPPLHAPSRVNNYGDKKGPVLTVGGNWPTRHNRGIYRRVFAETVRFGISEINEQITVGPKDGIVMQGSFDTPLQKEV